MLILSRLLSMISRHIRQHFPGAQYVENEIYMFSFHFPEDEAQIRMLVDAVVDVIKVAI